MDLDFLEYGIPKEPEERDVGVILLEVLFLRAVLFVCSVVNSNKTWWESWPKKTPLNPGTFQKVVLNLHPNQL